MHRSKILISTQPLYLQLGVISRRCSRGAQLQGFADSLTRLELLPTRTWVWELLGCMPHLRSLSTGCDSDVAEVCQSLSNLTELRLAFRMDIDVDLSPLTCLRVRFSALRPVFSTENPKMCIWAGAYQPCTCLRVRLCVIRNALLCPPVSETDCMLCRLTIALISEGSRVFIVLNPLFRN